MPLLIGIDEAGYGPNLGPLVICGTAWRVADLDHDLFSLLERWVTPAATGDGDRRLEVNDSKTLYHSGATVARLERSVLAALGSLDAPTRDAGRLLRHVAPGLRRQLARQPWYRGRWPALPVAAQPRDLESAQQIWGQLCERSPVCLSGVYCHVVLPGQFNRLVRRLGNKSAALSYATLRLARRMLGTPDQPSRVLCDRHGGRVRYAPLVQSLLSDSLVMVLNESSDTSRYRWHSRGVSPEIWFLVRGERLLPIALASMIAKYVRELFMMVWNAWWQQHIQGLRPTAGYPSDARRFMDEIRPLCSTLGVAEELVWRRV